MKPAAAIASLCLLVGVAQAAEKSAPRSDRMNPVVQFVNDEIQQGWKDNEVEPSLRADDAEWIRRVHLDLIGQIPSAEKTQEFLSDKSPRKRAQVINDLLESSDHVRYFTELWTNLLIGRTTPDRTSRTGMRKFLRERFARNLPWNETVAELITASGHYEENGAVNFLLAQMSGNANSDDYHVEATARITRVFMGMQVQCTQCHDHPFNDWKQDQFWEFNGFLRQVRREDHRRYDPKSGRNVDDYSELVGRNFNGPVFFETRNGLMQAVNPSFLGAEVDNRVENRREELARLLCHDDPQHLLAKAMVNRLWEHFMGFGFTRPVDDMGPHNPPSHPAVLDRLAEEFVASGYDLKELSRWICNTEAYHLSSQFGPRNQVDDPGAGESALFSRMYVKTLQAEQLYDSLLIATNAHQTGTGSFDAADAQRERWLRDFLTIFGGNEEDEPTLFTGTIPQALLMMNGPLVQKAISADQGSNLQKILTDPKNRNDALRIQALYLTVLNRPPTRPEMGQLQRALKSRPDPFAAYQDIYWALLNSNEFIVNH